MKNLCKLSLLIALFFSSSPAWSFVHFEPGIGYNRGAQNASKVQGIGLATKLGAEFSSFFVVADVGYHDIQVGGTSSATSTDLGLCIGGDFKTWRFWFTYVAAATLDIPSGANTNAYSGDGMKLGMSGRLSKKAYMNLEFRFIDINDLNNNPVAQLMNVAFLSVSWKLL